MRPADPSSHDPARALARARRMPRIALALIASCVLAAPALAQRSPGSFSLPEPTPAPAPAPQGPVDVREGVVIGPRVIEEPARRTREAPRNSTPTPVPTAPAPTTPTPAPRATAAPSPSPSRTPAPAAPRAETPAPRAAAPSPAASPLPDVPEPQETATLALPIVEPAAEPSAPQAEPVAPAAGESDLELRVHSPGLLDLVRAYEGWILGGLALIAALLASIWVASHLRARAVRRLGPPSLGSMMEDTAQPLSVLEPAAAPPRIDVRLDVVAASRSVMTLTLDVRFTLSNRSDRAVRGLTAKAKLDSARSGDGTGGGAAIEGAAPLGEIARIGPQQAATLSGQLRMPVSELGLIRQGSGRVFIPLIHLAYESESVPETHCSFVIGTPSAGGAGRLHPLPVAAPVGGIHGLAAQLVNIPEAPARTTPAAAPTAPEPA